MTPEQGKTPERKWLIIRKDTEVVKYLPLITDYINNVLLISDENIKQLNLIKARLYGFRFFLLIARSLYEECWLSGSVDTLNSRKSRLRQYFEDQCMPQLDYIQQLIAQITNQDQHTQFIEQANDAVAKAQLVLTQITDDADSIEI